MISQFSSFEASSDAGAQSMIVNRLVVGSISTRGNEILIKFIFPLLQFGVDAKQGVEFCHSTSNASRIRRKVGNEVS